ncbi:sulfotransferase [Chloroflexia bacterium SDU3-3]|nr:sulfotransferase [Chloroflexia bacterium SDU3-3]
MRLQLPEKARLFLIRWLFTPIYGMRFGEWARLLRNERMAVDLPYIPRALMVTGLSLVTSAIAAAERRGYDAKLAGVKVQPPVFILGHWRSGTTYLHNMMALDEQFAYASLWQALNPHIFLTTERYAALAQGLLPKTRITDNVGYSASSPLEDQFATTGSLCSQFLRWAFPRSAAHYDRYMTFRQASREDTRRWQAALLRFYQKLTWKYNRPLLLKSPPHTCRIKLLLELFPDARFIHIARDPYAVYQSSRREAQVIAQVTQLQRPEPFDMENWLIERYAEMYEAYFEERDLIPPGRLCEVRFEDVRQDPVGQIGQIYQSLGLGGFDKLLPKLQQAVEASRDYQNNSYAALPVALRTRLGRAWRRSFEAWGYPYEGMPEPMTMAIAHGAHPSAPTR